MGMRSLLLDFAGGTTMHGIPKAIRARSGSIRVFWIVVCLTATSMFCAQFIQLLTKYYSYPKKVTIEIVPLPVPFPAISLCNMRNLDTMVLNTLNQIFLNATDPDQNFLDFTNATSNSFINNYMSTVAKYYPLFQMTDMPIELFQTVLTRTLIATNIKRSLVQAAGVPFKEFVVTCKIGSAKCDRDAEFTRFFDSYYYNCFTYIAPPPANPESTLAEGLENGWSTIVLTGSGMLEKNKEVRMIPGSHDQHSPMASAEGVRVVFHPPGTAPYPHTEGFDVPPGYSVSFGVKAHQNIRIGPPHGECINTNPFPENATHYRLISCQKHCLQQAIVESCQCKDINLPGEERYPNYEYCTSDKNIPDKCRFNATELCKEEFYKVYNRIKCLRKTTYRITRNATARTIGCGCYPPCKEVTYDVSYSLTRWPAESFDGDEVYFDIFDTEGYPARFMTEADKEKYKLYAHYFRPSNRWRSLRDFSRLNVYIDDVNVVKTEETEDYSQSQLLSDIGGQLGLWVGISVITLAEMLELLVDIARYLGNRHGPYSQGKKFSRDPEMGHEHGQEEPLQHANRVHLCAACRSHVNCNGNIAMSAVNHHHPPLSSTMT